MVSIDGQNMNSSSSKTVFEVHVAKEDFKFNAAHFVAFDGFREPLHGHNYKVKVRLLGERNQIGDDGYLIDFGEVKRVTKQVCKKLNNHVLVPMLSDVLSIDISTIEMPSATTSDQAETQQLQQLTMTCQDGSIFSFPLKDVAQLPIVHASSEELAVYIYKEILEQVTSEYLRTKRGIHTMEITVMEAPGQEARFAWGVPEGSKATIDILSFIRTKKQPAPCFPASKVCLCCEDDRQRAQEQKLIERLAASMNKAGITGKDNAQLTCQDIENFLKD